MLPGKVGGNHREGKNFYSVAPRRRKGRGSKFSTEGNKDNQDDMEHLGLPHHTPLFTGTERSSSPASFVLVPRPLTGGHRYRHAPISVAPCAPSHIEGAFSLSAIPKEQSKIAQRFNAGLKRRITKSRRDGRFREVGHCRRNAPYWPSARTVTRVQRGTKGEKFELFKTTMKFDSTAQNPKWLGEET